MLDLFLVGDSVWWGLPERLQFLKTIVNGIEMALWPILIVVATAGSIYAVFLGINMAKAEDSGKRDEARKRMLNAVIAMGVTVVMILLINLVIVPNIPGWIAKNRITDAEYTSITGTSNTYNTYDKITSKIGNEYKRQEANSTTTYYEWHVVVDGNNKYLFATVTKSGDTETITFATSSIASADKLTQGVTNGVKAS